jgi:hypothetical protein
MSSKPERGLRPRHHRNWRKLGRRCACGLRWPCIDRNTNSLQVPAPGRARSADNAMTWPTTFYPTAPGAGMTRAQRWRGNGGRP